MRIYVGGSLNNVPRDQEMCQSFAQALGIEVVKQGHFLLNGCHGNFDREIAKAAYKWLDENDKAHAEERLISYCMRNLAKSHSVGRISVSALPDWQMTHPKLLVPEQIERSTVTIFVAGNEGTYWARNWALLCEKADYRHSAFRWRRRGNLSAGIGMASRAAFLVRQ